MNFSIRILLFVLFVSVSSVVAAQQVVFTQNHTNGVYQKGETIKVSMELTGIETDSILLKVDTNYANTAEWEKIPAPKEPLVLFEGKLEKPASMVFRIRTSEELTATGFIVAPDELQPATPRPADFDDFWKEEKAKLHALPVVVKQVQVAQAEPGYVCTDVELNCTGPQPARGYFAKPDHAENGTLPIVLNVHAAGVNGDWCLSKIQTAVEYAKKGKGALSFDLNAHGMLNGQPQEYYDDLQNGELKNYWESGAESRESNYFRGMYLRLMRTLDFLCAQPEWDGKRVIVIGESQGGGQALVAAGLDHRVTAVVATVPAMCDFGRTLIGETGGWPNPFKFDKDREKMLQTWPYFDAANILKGSKATLVTEIGLIDYTCPSFGIYAALNQSEGEKIIFPVPYRGHHIDQKGFQKEWEETVYKPKMEYIDKFLH